MALGTGSMTPMTEMHNIADRKFTCLSKRSGRCRQRGAHAHDGATEDARSAQSGRRAWHGCKGMVVRGQKRIARVTSRRDMVQRAGT